MTTTHNQHSSYKQTKEQNTKFFDIHLSFSLKVFQGLLGSMILM